MANQKKKPKIAILGGGLGSLVTALELTDKENWQDDFESITVYQMGWRLGGKGASGRGQNCRIEEHGLHVWMGWYENSFKLIRKLYKQLNRPTSAPLATWDKAFKKHSFICFGEEVGGKFKTWPIDFPTNDDTPGAGGEWPSLWSYIEMAVKALIKLLEGSLLTAPDHKDRKARGLWDWIKFIWAHIFLWIKRILRFLKVNIELAEWAIAGLVLNEVRKVAKGLRKDPSSHHPGITRDLLKLATDFKDWLQKQIQHDFAKGDDEARRLFYILDVAITCVIGVLSEGVSFDAHCLDKLDQYDFREFLRKHGAAEETINSALVKAFYDLMFAYRDGTPDTQLVATGVSIRFIFRMSFTYKGSIFWKMQAGMGDAVFTPMYQILRKRGVDVKFFHRVRTLHLSSAKQRVEQIVLGQQVTLKNGAYYPLFDCKGLPCWPAEPLYDQITQGAELKKDKINLESFWTPWKKREKEVVLKRGNDFDIVVFGISLASIPFICKELLDANEKWRDMVAHVDTVRTQAVQLWLKPDLKKLGWELQSPVSDAYPEPLDTWADMSHLIPRESWPQGLMPGNITYFCAPMPGDIPPESEHDAPEKEHDKLKKTSIDWFNKNTAVIWPDAVRSDNPKGLNWDLLIDPDNQSGVDRFNSQFWRVNMDPSERYVLSIPGTTRHRLRAADRHFENLYVTGDWIYTAVNAGCVEGTVISGMLCANAICGRPKIEDIIGYSNP